MQLWYASTSPFARKARIAVEELALGARVEQIEVDPWTDRRLRTLNPLAKVPTLVLDDGQALFESTVICDFLDALGPSRRLHPADGPERWRALQLQGLADGAATAAGRLFADENRLPDERSEAMMDRLRLALSSALEALDHRPPSRQDFTIGEIAVAALLGYLDFRWPDRDWRRQRKNLADWFGQVSTRASMTATEHRPARAS